MKVVSCRQEGKPGGVGGRKEGPAGCKEGGMVSSRLRALGSPLATRLLPGAVGSWKNFIQESDTVHHHVLLKALPRKGGRMPCGCFEKSCVVPTVVLA